MGVRGLETYMYQQVHHGTTQIDMRKEIQKHNAKKPNQKALIVIDFYGFVRAWQPKEELLCGYRAKRYMKEARTFLQGLIDAGAELVFFRDGPILSQKTDTWFKRRDKEYDDNLLVIDEIDKGTCLKELVTKQCVAENPSAIVSPLLKKVAQEVGTIHVSFNSECDLEIAAFACKNNALAVMADDSDFIIYPGNWLYWSIKQINQFRTVQYNKAALRADLSLSTAQLPLFASLGGNDLMPFDDLKSFHNRLGHYKYRFRYIANFIRPFPLSFGDEDLADLVDQVFCDIDNWRDYIPKIKTSIASYDINNETLRIKESDPFLKRLLEDDNDIHYKVLKRFAHSTTLRYDDLRKYESKEIKGLSYPEMAKRIHLRRVGVILNHKKTEDLTETLHIKTSHSTIYETITAKPEFPPDNILIPNLEALLFRNDTDNLDQARYKIFQWLHFDAFDADTFFSQPVPFVPLLANLAYLIRNWDITEDEADILVISYFDVLNDRVPEQLEYPKVLNPRAFRIVHMLLKLIRYTFSNLIVTGLRQFKTPFLFDGVYFHILYSKWAEMDEQEKQQRRDEIKQLASVYRSA